MVTHQNGSIHRSIRYLSISSFVLSYDLAKLFSPSYSHSPLYWRLGVPSQKSSQIPLQNIPYSQNKLQTVSFKPKFHIDNLNITLRVSLHLVLTFERFAISAAIFSSRSANTCTRMTTFGQNVYGIPMTSLNVATRLYLINKVYSRLGLLSACAYRG